MAITRSQMGSQLRGDRMPAKSKKQQRFMAAVANNPEFAEEVGVPKKVGEKFMKMKKGYKAGGKLNMVKGPDGKMVPDYAADGKGKMKKGGKVKKYQMGGMASMMREAPQDESTMKGRKGKKLPAPRRAPYDDSGTGLGGGPKGGPKGGGPMTGPKPMTGGPMPPKKKKKRAPMGGGGMGGAMPMMKKGGKVRGCGMARGGAVRSCKMVKMKGS
jgi:hypothetical protein